MATENVADEKLIEMSSAITSVKDGVGILKASIDEVKKDAVSQKKLDEFSSKFDNGIAELNKRIDGIEARAKAPGNGEPASVKHWSSIGDFAYHVYQASNPDGFGPGEKLRTYKAWCMENFASGVVNTNIPAEGGYLFPPEFRNEMQTAVTGFATFMDRCRRIPLGANNVTYPALELTSIAEATVASGVRTYWTNEVPAASITVSQPAFREIEFKLNELNGLVAISHKMMKYSPVSVDSLLTMLFGKAIAYKIEKSILWGTGAGQPLGIKNAANVVVSKTRDAATKVTTGDIDAMLIKMPPALYASSVWLAHPTTLPSLSQLEVAVGTGGSAAYMPPGGYAQAPYATLRGLPVIYTPHCDKLGDNGDLWLVNLGEYGLAENAPEFLSSIHLYFDYGKTAFRMWTEMDGQPLWTSYVQDEYDTTLYYSPFIYLA